MRDEQVTGNTDVFSRPKQRGDQNFFTYAKGGDRKNWEPSITNRHPLLVKK